MNSIENQMYEYLRDEIGVSEEALDLVANINGWSESTAEDILCAVAGLRDFDQAEGEGYERPEWLDDEDDEDDE